MDVAIITATTDKDKAVGILNRSISIILIPINTNTKAKPYFSKLKRSAISANRKYIERKPKIAKIFEVKTINGSVVIAKIAGIESTAKIRSENSTSTSTKNSGVA